MFTCVWYTLEDKSTVKNSKEAHLETLATLARLI